MHASFLVIVGRVLKLILTNPIKDLGHISWMI